MDSGKINRAYLETLSFSDLVKLSDEYGIDVPENLDRRFLIGELLEVAEEEEYKSEEMELAGQDYPAELNEELPQSFNETKISCVLRNPVWAFVFWTISDSDMNMLKSLPFYDLMLRVCALSQRDDLNPEEAFEINAARDDFEQYVLLPRESRYIRIELVFTSGANKKILAFSPVMELPASSSQLNDFVPGREADFPEIIKISGIEKILIEQYKNHRHSFS